MLSSEICEIFKNPFLLQNTTGSCFCVSEISLFLKYHWPDYSETFRNLQLRLLPAMSTESYHPLLRLSSLLYQFLLTADSIKLQFQIKICLTFCLKSIFLANWLIFTNQYLISLSTNPTKCSDTLKKFVGNRRRIVWVWLNILWGWYLKGLCSFFWK